MSQFKHVFFDLDRTLWDMDGNSYQTICELAVKHNLTERGIGPIDEFISKYKVINDQLWYDYSNDLVDKETLRSERFKRAFGLYGIRDEQLSQTFGNDYITYGPLKSQLIPHTIEVLEYLSSKYKLHIITNGFQEVQLIKIENSNLKKFFNAVVTSDEARCKKPDTKIFEYSLNQAGALASDSIMIGDSLEADVIGARKSGLAQVFFNPERKAHTEKVTFEIASLKELRNIL
ncbi:MAG TPA: YjjG family noncanonical pyrimidine nucleotidase [Bacteroidia bacterium]|jgi:putative hydrolase of the HAD superfamily